MLHAPGAFPRGAITPAKVLLWPTASSSADGAAGQGSALLWVHPAGYAEAVGAVQACCQQQGVAVTDRWGAEHALPRVKNLQSVIVTPDRASQGGLESNHKPST